MDEHYFEDSYTNAWLENGIGWQVYKPDLKITLEVAEVMVKRRKEAFGYTPRPFLTDIRNLLFIDAASRRYLASNEAGEFLTAEAIIVGDPVTVMVGNVFILLDQPSIPTRLFRDKDLAVEWLNQFKQ